MGMAEADITSDNDVFGINQNTASIADIKESKVSMLSRNGIVSDAYGGDAGFSMTLDYRAVSVNLLYYNAGNQYTTNAQTDIIAIASYARDIG